MPLRTNKLNLHYTLTMVSAFHFGTGLRKGLVHRSVAQDKDGYLYIPGSTFKGSLRNQAYDLHYALKLPSRFPVKDPHRGADDLLEFKSDPEVTRFIFGTRFHPCTLCFDDAHLHEDDKKHFDAENAYDKKYLSRQMSTRTQVHLSRLTRTAEPGMLFTSELGLRQLRFNGRIYGHLTGVAVEPPGNYSYSLIILLATLQTISRLGGNKSTGGGEICCSVSKLLIDNETIDPKAVLQSLADLDLYQIAWGEL